MKLVIGALSVKKRTTSDSAPSYARYFRPFVRWYCVIKTVKNQFRRFRLKYRLLLIVIIVFLAPTLFFSVLLLNSYAQTQMEQSVKAVQSTLERSSAQVEQNAQACVLTTQSFLNNQGLTAALQKFLEEEDDAHALELLNFKLTEVMANDRLINNNPYLYQVRIYMDNDRMTEIMPLVYNRSRMKRQLWYRQERSQMEGWHFDYSDQLFDTESWSNEQHLASLISPCFSFSGSYLGILEVSTRMDLLFPVLYQNDEDNWNGFLDKNGHLYYRADDNQWMPDVSAIPEQLDPSLGELQSSIQKTKNGTYILCYYPLSSLPGGLVTASRLDEALRGIKVTQYLLVAGIALLGLCFCLFISKLIDVILKRFYRVIAAIESIQAGNLNTEIPETGEKDEIGILATSIRRMSERIQGLVAESVEQERLVKDSEIRALQNQINTHFIYNVLESIKMMAEIEAKYDISDAVTALGKLLRYSMRWSSPMVPVGDELEYIRNYIALMRLRYDYNIFLEIEVPPELSKQLIPKMSLQPIIENAIYHGIDGLSEDAFIQIRGIRCQISGEEAFRIEITDSGRGMTPEQLCQLRARIAGEIPDSPTSSHGIGLKNVQDRIRLFFGEPYKLEVTAVKDGYTKVSVTIPLREK